MTKKISKKKMVVRGTIKNLSPCMIGSGMEENSDRDLLRDSNGNFYIPATPLIGILRHKITLDGYQEELDYFWGYTKGKQGKQSCIRFRDLAIKEGSQNIVIRDGIKIEPTNGMVKPGAKYDYEVLDPGNTFDLYFEVDIEEYEEFALRMVKTITELLQNSQIRLGAKTNNGMGKVALQEHQVYLFDFTQKEDVLRWLQPEDKKFACPTKLDFEPFPLSQNEFVIEASFSLKTSLIIGSYPANANAPDKVHLQANGNNIISGSSLKGALRTRMEKILRTLFPSKDVSQLIEKLFGNVDPEDKDKEIRKGKLLVEEVILTDKLSAEVQARIKVDRFTGGTIEGALFDSEPLFGNELIEKVRIIVSSWEQHEIGLLLLAFKDLWTGDLAVGGEKNVGRGVLCGNQAKFIWDNNEIVLRQQQQKLEIQGGSQETLQVFVDALIKKGETL